MVCPFKMYLFYHLHTLRIVQLEDVDHLVYFLLAWKTNRLFSADFENI